MSNHAFIRPCRPTDIPALDHIFRETCDQPLKIEPVWTIASYLWCHPYPILAPSTCFVLDDGQGRAVGYILGTSNTARFCEGWQTIYVPNLDRDLLPPPNTASGDKLAASNDRAASLLNGLYNDVPSMLNAHFPGLWQNFPGHLHIDILPSHQGQGWGKRMIDTLIQALKAEGCHGVHLGMVASNTQANSFYSKLGFERFPVVLDNGRSGELGRTGDESSGVLYLAKKI